MPYQHISNFSVIPDKIKKEFYANSGNKFPKELIEKSTNELAMFQQIMEDQGVKVLRPEINLDKDFGPVKTPDFECENQFYAAMPRDILITIGNTIVEAPMAWRSRFFEYRYFRQIAKELFKQGGNWIAAPKAQMGDDSYN